MKQSDILLVFGDRVLVVRELSEAYTGTNAAACSNKYTVVVYSVRSLDAPDNAAGKVTVSEGLVLESTCDPSLYPQHPRLRRMGMRYQYALNFVEVEEVHGMLYIRYGNAKEQAFHAEVVYDIMARSWRRWFGPRNNPARLRMPLSSSAQCFECLPLAHL